MALFRLPGVEILSSSLQKISQTSSHDPRLWEVSHSARFEPESRRTFLTKEELAANSPILVSVLLPSMGGIQNKFRLTQIACHRSSFYTKAADAIFAIPNLAAGRKGRKKKRVLFAPRPPLAPSLPHIGRDSDFNRSRKGRSGQQKCSFRARGWGGRISYTAFVRSSIFFSRTACGRARGGVISCFLFLQAKYAAKGTGGRRKTKARSRNKRRREGLFPRPFA